MPASGPADPSPPLCAPDHDVVLDKKDAHRHRASWHLSPPTEHVIELPAQSEPPPPLPRLMTRLVTKISLLQNRKYKYIKHLAYQMEIITISAEEARVKRS